MIEEGRDTVTGRETGVYTVACVHTIRRMSITVNPAAARSNRWRNSSRFLRLTANEAVSDRRVTVANANLSIIPPRRRTSLRYATSTGGTTASQWLMGDVIFSN
jgi:hypothetical protein